jgi:hypothetical protein
LYIILQLQKTHTLLIIAAASEPPPRRRVLQSPRRTVFLQGPLGVPQFDWWVLIGLSRDRSNKLEIDYIA